MTCADEIFGFFISCQEAVKQLNSGDLLAVDGECCRSTKGSYSTFSPTSLKI